jgi:hypothetical protein
LRWSEPRPFSPGFYALYALVGIIGLVELVIFWHALNPRVPDTYRAYYIDRSATCLPQPVAGTYEIGTVIELTTNTPPSRELRPCGWQGPAGDGLHAVGTSAQLYLAPAGLAGAELALNFTATAVDLPETGEQRIVVHANDVPVGALRLERAQTGHYSFRIPAEAVTGRDSLRIVFDFPDAVRPAPRSTDGQRRSIKLERFALVPVEG